MNQSARPDLSILIVTWNVWPLLQACLASIAAHSTADPALPPTIRRFGQGAKLEVVVVDNAASPDARRDETATALPQEFPWVRLIAAEGNLGFTGGNNLAYAHAQGDVIFFLNPDTELLPGPHGEDSLWTLYAILTATPDLMAVGPRLYYGDGSVQNNRRRFPTPLTGFMESTRLGQLWRGNPWARRYHMRDWPNSVPHDVEWLSGAALMVRRAALELIRQPEVQGPFDEAFFMYSEEVDLCRRLKSHPGLVGSRIVYLPAAQIRHHEGRSSEQVGAARLIRFNRAKVYYWQKHFGPRWAALLHGWLRLDIRIRMAEEQFKWLVGHKRPLRAQRIADYRAVLRTGLDQPTPHTAACSGRARK